MKSLAGWTFAFGDFSDGVAMRPCLGWLLAMFVLGLMIGDHFGDAGARYTVARARAFQYHLNLRAEAPSFTAWRKRGLWLTNAENFLYVKA